MGTLKKPQAPETGDGTPQYTSATAPHNPPVGRQPPISAAPENRPGPAWATAALAVAGAVSGIYAAAGTYWATGGHGFPFGAGDTQAEGNGELLREVTPGPGGAVMSLLGVGGVLVAVAMARGTRRLRFLLLSYGVTLAVWLTLVLPGARAVKYLPPLGLLAFLRPPAWSTVNYLVLMVGGFAWAGATLAYFRASRTACLRCGGVAGEVSTGWLDRHRHAITWVAVTAPWGYALYRICWALDVPLGVPQAFLDRINAANPGHQTRILELVLASFAIGGSVLTFGLLRPWSQTFPRWVLGLAGRPVPSWFPAGLAALVAFELTAFGISLLPEVVQFYAGDRDVDGFSMGLLYPVPALTIVLWGVSLGLAALAFRRYRRPACAHAVAIDQGPGGH